MGRCINQRGSYTCSCELGFAFDSTNTTCLPLDLCLTGDHGNKALIERIGVDDGDDGNVGGCGDDGSDTLILEETAHKSACCQGAT